MMDIKELGSGLFALTSELSSLEQKITDAAKRLDVDELQKLLPRRSALNHAIAAGQLDLDELMDAAARSRARMTAETARVLAAEQEHAKQRAFNVGAARDVRKKVEYWQAQKVNQPAFGRPYQEEQVRKAQAELDRLMAEWNIKEEEL